MILTRGFRALLFLGLIATSAAAQETEEDKAKSPRRGLFGLFGRDKKKEEPEKPKEPAKKEEPKKEAPEKEVEKPEGTPAPAPKAEPKKETVPPPMAEKMNESPKPAPQPPSATKPEAGQKEPPKTQEKSMAAPAAPPEPAPSPKPEPEPQPKAEPTPAPIAEAKKEAPAAAPPPSSPSSSGNSKKEAAMDQIRAAIRAGAKEVERVRKKRGQETGDFAERVDALVTRPEKPPVRRGFREERILESLRRPTAPFQFTSRIQLHGRGFLLDDSPDGRQVVIDELYQTKAEGAREVERLLQLSDLWKRQRRSEEAIAMAQRAVLLARELVKAKPNDATAHGLLAEGLSLAGDEMRAEMLMEVEASLKLEPENARAMLVRLVDGTGRLREHLLREGPRRIELPARDPREVLRRLHAQPPTDEGLAAHATAAAELRRLATKIMDHSAAKPDLMLRAAAAVLAPALDQQIANLARANEARSFEQFELMAAEVEAKGAQERMEQVGWTGMMQRVMEAAEGDGPMIAVVTGLPALWAAAGMDARIRENVWAKVPEKYRQLFEKGMDRAAQVGRRENAGAAAKACEAVACFEVAAAAMGAKVRHEGMALRAIELDPWRIHAVDLVGASCANGFANGAQALMAIREAVLSGYSSLQRCAAAALLAQDWAAAERHLQSCLLLRPGSLEVLNHLIAVRLLGEQTPERYAEVETRFQRARQVLSEKDDSLPQDVKEAFISNYIVFLCLKDDHKSAAGVFAISVTDGRIAEPTARELALLIKSAL